MGEHYVVYRFLNTASGKSYIGITHSFRRRKSDHIRRLKQGNHHSIKLQNAWNKYTEDAFTWAIIDKGLSQIEAEASEFEWIAHYDSFHNGYNMNEGGNVSASPDFNSVPCTWNDIGYPSVSAAARALGIGSDAMQKRLSKGYSKDDDMSRKTDAQPCVWNGIEYASLAAAAEAVGITYVTMRYRLKKGYACDEDMPNTTKTKQVVWNNRTYSSLTQAAEALGVATGTMTVRVQMGYTCDEDMIGIGINNPKSKSCVWNGVSYASISDAARAMGISFSNMQNRLRNGWACDSDIQYKRKA